MADDAYWRQRAEERFADAAREAIALASELSGVDEDEATNRITEAGLQTRVVERDGVPFTIRLDRRPRRVNLTIREGKVTAAEVF
jgi:hypothetical protein